METIPPTTEPTSRSTIEALLCRLLRVAFNRPVVLPAGGRSRLGDRLY